MPCKRSAGWTSILQHSHFPPCACFSQGGYKAFWRAFPELCEGGYRPMDHPDFTEQLKVRAWRTVWHRPRYAQRRQLRDANASNTQLYLLLMQACHKVVKQAWAKTTHTYGLKQRQRRPSYRLRQSSGAPSGSTRDCDMAPAEEVVMKGPPPAWRAAQHSTRTHT